MRLSNQMVSAHNYRSANRFNVIFRYISCIDDIVMDCNTFRNKLPSRWIEDFVVDWQPGPAGGTNKLVRKRMEGNM
jgi:hypothetical protein